MALAPEPRKQSHIGVASDAAKVVSNLVLRVQTPVLLQAALSYTGAILSNVHFPLFIRAETFDMRKMAV